MLYKKRTGFGKCIWIINCVIIVFYLQFILYIILKPYGYLNEFVMTIVSEVNLFLAVFVHLRKFKLFAFLDNMNLLNHIIVFILLAGTGVFFWKAGFFSKERKPAFNEEYPDYNSLLDMKSIILVKDFDSYTPDGKVLDKNTYKGIIIKKGKILKGYIEIIVSQNNKPLTIWESIYFKSPYDVKEHNKCGGHIFRPKSLEVPASDKTHLLLPLNNIPFLSNIPYDESRNPENYNLFEYINNRTEIKYLVFISSLRPAKIDCIKIYYEGGELGLKK